MLGEPCFHFQGCTVATNLFGNGILGAGIEPRDIPREPGHGRLVVERVRAIGRAVRACRGELQGDLEVVHRLREDGGTTRQRVHTV